MALLTTGLRRGTAALTAALILGANAAAQAPPQTATQPTDDDVKAEYLYKFTEYIRWPPPIMERAPAFTICVVAETHFTRTVRDVLQGRTVFNKPIAMRRPDSAAAARQCHVLYMSRSELARSDWLVEALENDAVLLVSDAPDFLERGGTIALVLENNRVRYDVHLPAAKRVGLTINSRLLRSARRVIEAGGGQ